MELWEKVSGSKLRDYKNKIYFKIFSKFTILWSKYNTILWMWLWFSVFWHLPARTQKGTPKITVILAPYSSYTVGIFLEMKVPKQSGK
jgi:hypothetical protein